MSVIRVFASKLRSLFSTRRPAQEFDEELETHLSLLAEKYVRQGMTPEEAYYEARRQFGNLGCVKESRYERRTFACVQDFGQDLRYGLRLLKRNPGFAAVAFLTLALGIGANTAIFSMVYGIILKPLPFPEAERLVVPATVFQRYDTDRGSNSFADILDWRAQTHLFESVAAVSGGEADLTGGQEPERVRALFVDEYYFPITKTPPLAGRFFVPEENLPKATPTVVLGHSLWMRRFGGDPNVVGSEVEIAGTPARVIGVTRQGSTWPEQFEIFRPLGSGGPPDKNQLRRDNHIYNTVARLRPGVTMEQAQAELAVMGDRISREETNRAGTNWKLHSLRGFIVGPSVDRTLLVLLGAVLFVLLIACVNVANLLLARGAARQREVAIRGALGAGWKRLTAQFLAESALLSAGGGLAGVFLGYWGLKALVSLAPPNTPRLDEISMNLAVLVFAAGLCLLTTVIAGVAPAIHAARMAPAESIHDAGRSVAGGRRGNRMRTVLVVSELALAIILLSGAGLLIRSFQKMQDVHPGFRTENLLTIQMTMPRSRYPQEQVAKAFAEMTEAVRRIPGVVGVSAASSLPLGGGGFYLGRVFLREGQAEPPETKDTRGSWSVVQPGYFRTMGIPIVLGRDFTEFDRKESAPVIVISEKMAREMFPNENPLGRRIRSWRDENLYREIVGVAGDVRYNGLGDTTAHNVYVPHTQNAWASLALVIRTTGDPHVLLASIKPEIWSRDRKLTLANPQTMEEAIGRQMAGSRFSMFLLGVFGLTALVLAAIGIYGLMAYSVTQRTREIGIRMALGALRGQVFGMVAWSTLRLAAAGAVIGLAGALAITRLLEALLFEVSATDARTLSGAALLLVLVTLAAGMVPARRATRVDPVTTLRCE